MARSNAGRMITAGLESPEAVRAAYSLYGAELYRFVVRGLGDRGAAEDVVQETFLRAWRAKHRFDPQIASLRVWLFAIARNAMIDHSRGARSRPWQQDLIDPQSTTAAEVAESDQIERLVNSWAVQEALGRLTPEHRVALMETYVRDRPYADVAAELGIPIGTLRSRVFYGLKALRVGLDEIGVNP